MTEFIIAFVLAALALLLVWLNRPHRHKWRRYVLLDELRTGEVRKVFTVYPLTVFPDGFYVGWECRCGEQGYPRHES